MARDRQRAKQRRRRQGGSAPRGERSSARLVTRLDDATVDDAGLGDTAGTPNPLKHSSAEVDEALLAEAGATPPEVGDADELPEGVYEDELVDDDFERAPDEAEDDLVPAGSGAATPRSRTSARRASRAAGSHLPPALRRRAPPRPVAEPSPGRAGHRRRARLRRPRRGLPRPAGRALEAHRRRHPLAPEIQGIHVSLVRHQHLFRAREQGQAEPRAPRVLARPDSAPCARSSCRPRPCRR